MSIYNERGHKSDRLGRGRGKKGGGGEREREGSRLPSNVHDELVGGCEAVASVDEMEHHAQRVSHLRCASMK